MSIEREQQEEVLDLLQERFTITPAALVIDPHEDTGEPTIVEVRLRWKDIVVLLNAATEAGR